MMESEGTTLTVTAESPEEEIEGTGTAEDEGWGEYPIDTLLIRQEARTVFDVVRRINAGGYVMDPDFQRDFIWPEDKQSKLIESVLMRIPLPVFYLAEDEKGRTIVVDGLQRLSTFVRFFNGELKLKLPDQAELNKMKFSDLSPKLKNRVEDCNLILYIVDAKVPERARLDIFERVNGGVPLTRQQMRNCLHNGPATQFLKAEANSEPFLRATGKSLKTQTMRDREFVNRFCAFQLLPLEGYAGDMDDWLARALKTMNAKPAEELIALSEAFRRSLDNNARLFGEHAFRKHKSGQERRGILNASLWDVMSIGLSSYSQAQIEAHAEKFRERFFELLADTKFDWSITYGPNTTDRVQHRFQAMNKLLNEVFDAAGN